MMDINEVTGQKINRHPWELSRTSSLLQVFLPYINRMITQNKAGVASYINVGAGDLFFDRTLLRQKQELVVYAVDTGYETLKSRIAHINLYHSLEDFPDTVDFAFMMDSLEYMEDDLSYIRELSDKVRPGGYLFFTLPAFSFLFSEHDRIVKNLRRYDRKAFHELIRQTDTLDIEEEQYFYTTLFTIRFLQKTLRLPIDPDHKVTTGWPYRRRHPLTVLVQMILDADFTVNRLLSKHGFFLPGLSLLVICRRK